MLSYSAIDRLTRLSSFAVQGRCVESFFSLATTAGSSFVDARAELTAGYAATVENAGLSDSTAVFCPILLSERLSSPFLSAGNYCATGASTPPTSSCSFVVSRPSRTMAPWSEETRLGSCFHFHTKIPVESYSRS
jgi:hypothetical protein